MSEEWKQISGYEGLYEVSNLGRVRSMAHEEVKKDGSTFHRSARMVHQKMNKDGYSVVRLTKECNVKYYVVHILVARAFVDGWFDGAEVNHKDFDRVNNRSDNLEWTTHKENVAYTIRAGRHVCNSNLFGENNPNYGNHKLRDIYASNPDLSKEKQGRPGEQNGRAKRVVAIDEAGNSVQFGTIKDCAKFFHDNNDLSQKIENLSIRITKCINSGVKFCGYSLEFL